MTMQLFHLLGLHTIQCKILYWQYRREGEVAGVKLRSPGLNRARENFAIAK